MNWYRYTRTPGDSRDGLLASPIEDVFTARNDKEAKEKARKLDEAFVKLGGFIANPILECGVNKLTRKVVREFKSTRIVAVPSEFSYSATSRE